MKKEKINRTWGSRATFASLTRVPARLVRSLLLNYNLSTAHLNKRSMAGRVIGRKGQMEMIGLVVIVILITLGMLFMAKFALESEPKEKVFVRKGLVDSTMVTLMYVSVNCEVPFGVMPYRRQPTIGKELIDDCAEYYSFGSSTYECLSKSGATINVCDFLNETIGDLLNQTLGKWKAHYKFESVLWGYGDTPMGLIEIKDEEGKGCPRKSFASNQVIQTDAGLVENVLYLCY